MNAHFLLRSVAGAALLATATLPYALLRVDSPAQASSLPACAQTSGCLAEVVNPGQGRTLGGRVAISNEGRLPVIAVMYSNGGLAYLPTIIGQTILAPLTVVPLSPVDALASIQARGGLTPVSATHVTVKLDGKAAYAVVPRLRITFASKFEGKPIIVGEGSFADAPFTTRIAVAAGGTITLAPPAAVTALPLPGFVLQVKVLGKWTTVANGRIPASAPARFAEVPGKTWTCSGSGGGCIPAS